MCILAARSCPTLCDPMTVARQAPLSMGFSRQEYWILEWVAMPSSRGSFQPRDQTQVSSIAGGFFTFYQGKKQKKSIEKCKNVTCMEQNWWLARFDLWVLVYWPLLDNKLFNKRDGFRIFPVPLHIVNLQNKAPIIQKQCEWEYLSLRTYLNWKPDFKFIFMDLQLIGTH